MYSYCQVKEWHSKNLTRTPSLDGEEPNGVEIAFNRSYVRQKLDNGLLRVWRVSVHVLRNFFCPNDNAQNMEARKIYILYNVTYELTIYYGIPAYNRERNLGEIPRNILINTLVPILSICIII